MSNDDTIIKRLEGAIGSDCVLTGQAAESYGAGAFTPSVVVIPGDREQAAEVVRIAADAGVGIVPCGGRTKLNRPPAPGAESIALSTERFAKIVEHDPRDLTVTVESGLPLGTLSTALHEHGQRLSIDPPNADRATLGGICATADSGPLRYRYGTMRDLVLGMETVGADSVATHSGARVVKNVAGYDMFRLHIGASGSLGLITEMTFRLHPLPEAFRLAVVRCGDGERAEQCIASILAGRTQPVLVDLITPVDGVGANAAPGTDAVVTDAAVTNAPGTDAVGTDAPGTAAPGIDAVGSDGWTLVLGYEDCAEAVEWQCKHVAESMPVPVDILDEADSRSVYGVIREWTGSPATVAFKATMKSSRVVDFHAWANNRGYRLLSRAANGVVHGCSDDPATIAAAGDLAAAARDGGGQITWTALPAEANVPIWQPRRGDLAVMKRIKQIFDPDGVFAPGRFVDAM